MTKKRKPIGKKTRFEVFKRDSFTCQYCGDSAPDVVLHVDHIKPVIKGGTNELLNLITACISCNLGKGHRSLDDKTAVEKKRQQMDDLQDRREQIELMIAWQEGLSDVTDLETNSTLEYFSKLFPGHSLNAKGEHEMAARIRKFGYQDVRRVMEIASDQYLEFEQGAENATSESVEVAIGKLTPIPKNRKRYRNPDDSGLEFYASKVLSSKMYLSQSAQQYIHQVAKSAYDKGVDADAIKRAARQSSSHTAFHDSVEQLLEDLE